jgi:peptide-methionine (S)-S-oxide reductase
MEQIILAGGKSTVLKGHLEELSGVVKVTLGYSGGNFENPSKDDVASQTTGHAEVVLVEYEPSKITTMGLLEQFFELHDPTLLNRQGTDTGEQFRSAIFYVTEDQKEIAEQVIREAQKKFGDPIVTQVAQAGPFYKASE